MMTGSDSIKVMIVDDCKLTVVGLKTTIKHFDGVEVIGNAENGKIAIDLVKEINPDVILMDIGMPVMDGIECTKALRNLKNASKIIMLTSHDSESNVMSALSAGANSYCMKDIEPEILISVIKSTYNGATWLDPRIASIVLNSLNNKDSEKSKDVELTDREIDLLKLIAKGYSNTQISDALYISLNTVKTHLKNIFKKLEVEDRTHAVMQAVKKEIISQD